MALIGVWNCNMSELEGNVGTLFFQVRDLSPREEQCLTGSHSQAAAKPRACSLPFGSRKTFLHLICGKEKYERNV